MSATHHAFGLALAGDLRVPGTAGAAAPDLPLVALRAASRDAVLGGWPAGAADVSRRRGASGRTVHLVAHHPDAGVLLRGLAHGVARIAPDGGAIACAAPTRGPAWRHPRWLVAQVLPFAALLHGREALHAAAIERGGRAVAVVAPAGGGKSTLLAALVARGAPLVADDVLAVDAPGGTPRAHPGPAVMALRDGGAAALAGGSSPAGVPGTAARAASLPGEGAAAPASLPGEEVARMDDGSWRLVPRAPGPLPLGAVVVLDRGGHDTIEVRPVTGPAAPLLLGATFNAAWRHRDRLVTQLDVVAAIGRHVPVLRLTAPTDAPPDALAAALEEAVA